MIVETSLSDGTRSLGKGREPTPTPTPTPTPALEAEPERRLFIGMWECGGLCACGA